MLHRHTSRIGPYSAQFKLTVGCEVIGKARPNPTFPLPWRGRFYSQGHIVRRKKCREKRMSGVVPMLGSAEADFPTNRMRKENGDWRGEAAANVTNARVGAVGKEPPEPQCLASCFGRLPLWESLGFLVNSDEQPTSKVSQLDDWILCTLPTVHGPSQKSKHTTRGLGLLLL